MRRYRRASVLSRVILRAYVTYIPFQIYSVSVDTRVAVAVVGTVSSNSPPHLSVNMRPMQIVIHDGVVLDQCEEVHELFCGY
jgi:hypothetical protein